MNNMIIKIARLGRSYLWSGSEDTSYCGEYGHIKAILAKLSLKKGYVVDMAASDGVTYSCTLGFFKDSNWAGLAIEMDPSKFLTLAFIYSNFAHAQLARSRVTPSNVVNLLRGFEVPFDFTFLNLDIDSYDLYVMDELLKSEYKPKVISMEINEKVPPPVFFTVNFDESYHWEGDHFYGCSLSAASHIVKPRGYILESLQYNNAMFVRSDVAAGHLEDKSVEIAYAAGYRDRPDRKRLFSHNSNVDCVLNYTPQKTVEFFREYFRKYDGKYTLRLKPISDCDS